MTRRTTRRSTSRLSRHVRPASIDLHFELDPRKASFRGEAAYVLALDKRTRRIELNAADLRVSGVRVQLGEEKLKPQIEMHSESETIVLHFDRLLPTGEVRVELKFRGRVRNDLRGLYRSVDDEAPWIATQLCPTDARRFFPCFDEPGIKMRYRIAVTAPRELAVISNSPVESVAREGATHERTQFETTPPLSAYLVAVAVGPFVASPTKQCGPTEIRVWTVPGKLELAAFAAEAARESLSRLEEWFALEHPYPKLDLVALPDFAFGAMENAGAVFFRDSILLLDEARASAEDRKRAGETIAHELSHMWFGNLVTMAWWNDLWLNESFATWMAYVIIDDWQPDWKIWSDFAHRREAALEVDALATSHPIAPRIRSAEEAHENFDAITYTKGACVLRMLEGYLGPEVFREGIRLYIRRHAEAAATAEDLWAAISEVSGVDVERIVSPWTLQTGYPLLRARPDKSGATHQIALAQERFLALPPRTSGRAKKPVRWAVPWLGRIGPAKTRSGARTGQDCEVRHLLTKTRDRVPVGRSNPEWIYANANESGFFRVEHDPSNTETLVLRLPQLSPIERIGFVGHQWALTRAGRSSIGVLLDLLAALGDESDPDVLLAAEQVLVRLSRRLAPSRGNEVEQAFRKWISRHYAGQLDRLGLEGSPREDERQRMQRGRLFSIVGHLARDSSVTAYCASRTARHFAHDEALPPALADEIVWIAASVGDAELHATLCDATRRAKTPQERRRMLFGLAEFDAPQLVRASLRASLDPAFAPIPDRAGLIAALLSRPATAGPTWTRLQQAWPRLERQMPPILLARLASATAEALPHSSASEIRRFFEAHPLAAGSRVLRQVREQMTLAKRFEAAAGSEFEAILLGD